MRHLVPEFWSEFKQDGKLFEKLVGELLSCKYNGITFLHTGGPHDGGKDFRTSIPFLPDSYAEVWAECKYHQESLPFNEISTTLLMAYIENAKKILIFTYSPVNKNFNMNMARYRERTKLEVSVYDDIALETLIFKHKDDIRFNHYFPNYVQQSTPAFEKREIECNYLFRTAQDSNSCKETLQTINLNDKFYLDAYLTNPNSFAVTMEISMPRSGPRDNLDFADAAFIKDGYRTEIVIPEHSTKLVEFPARLKKYVQKVKFPKLIIKYFESEKTCAIKQRINCRWLAETPIIGSAYHDFMTKSKAHLFNDFFAVSTLIGGSGVGKSRLLNEIAFMGVRLGRRVILIDTDCRKMSAQLFAEKICSELVGLPLFNAEQTNMIWLENECEPNIKYAAKILYCNDFDIQKEKRLVAKYFVKLMSEIPCLILLDNLQNYDEITLDILHLILDYANGQAIPASMVASINKDYMYSATPAEQLCRRLEILSVQNPVRFSMTEFLGFSVNDAKLFIKECLTFETESGSYDNIPNELAIEKIVESCGPTPFFLQNYLLYLEQTGIIKRTRTTSFYIFDVAGFQDSLKTIPKGILALLAVREERLISHISGSKDLLDKYYMLIYLLVLTGSLPGLLYNRLINSCELLDLLKDLAFVSQDDNGSIIFYHSYIRIYYSGRYPEINIPAQLLEDFVTATESLALEQSLIFPVFWAKYMLDKMDWQYLNKVSWHIIRNNVESNLSDSCVDAVSILLEKYQNSTEISTYLKTYWKLTRIIGARKGIQHRFKYYKRVYDGFLAEPQRYANHIDGLFLVLREYLINLLNSGKTQESLQKNHELFQVFQKMDIDNYQRDLVLVKLYNCQVMVHNHLNQMRLSIDANNKSIMLIRGLKDTDEMIATWRGRGDIYYTHSSAHLHKNDIADCWLTAYKEYVNKYGGDITSETSSQLKVSTYLKALMANMMLSDELAVDKISDFISLCIGNTGMMHYEISSRMVKALYLIWKHDSLLSVGYPSVLAEIDKLINQATDMAAVYGLQSSYIKCFYLRAIFQLKTARFEHAYDNFSKIASMLSATLCTEAEYLQWNYFWVEFAIQTRRMEIRAEEIDLSCLRNAAFQKELQEVLNAPQRKFQSYLDDYEPLSPLCDRAGKLSYPKV